MRTVALLPLIALTASLTLLARARAEEPPAASPPASQRLVTKVVELKDGDVTLKGHLAYDPTISALRPAVLVIHDWWGQGAFAKETAEKMVAWGYVGFAVDMYGDARVVSTPQEAGALAGACRANGAEVGRRRVRLALEALKAYPFIDAGRSACLGFCFGGTMSLELAWSGAPIKAAISFHGTPTTPREGEAWTAEILVLHGADDPFVAPELVTALQDRMRQAKGAYEIVQYSGALHSFTDPGVDRHNLPGAKYDARAATRAFARCQALLAEVFARK